MDSGNKTRERARMPAYFSCVGFFVFTASLNAVKSFYSFLIKSTNASNAFRRLVQIWIRFVRFSTKWRNVRPNKLIFKLEPNEQRRWIAGRHRKFLLSLDYFRTWLAVQAI